MKRAALLFAGVCLVLLLVPAFSARSQPAPRAGSVEVSFVFGRRGGFASNQFAVWIEDIRGTYVATLYATKFTASGGWKKRDQSVPQWVKQSGLAGMNKTQIDAVSGPTPKTGTLRYTWNGTGQAGPAAPGDYKVFVEATLRNENRVLYTADIRLGGSGTITPQPRYFGDSAADRGMVSQVTVTFGP